MADYVPTAKYIREQEATLKQWEAEARKHRRQLGYVPLTVAGVVKKQRARVRQLKAMVPA